MRYRDRFIRDEHGDDLADDHAALERALTTAKGLLHGALGHVGKSEECVIEVTNDNGAVWRLPVVEAIGTPGG
jgi:hypothetical protein